MLGQHFSQRANQEPPISQQRAMRYPCAGRSPPNIFFVFSKPSIVHRPILDPLHSKFPLSRLRHPRRLQLKRELDSQMYITCAALRARCCAGCCAETEDTVLISRELRFPFSFQSLLFCSRRACSTPGWAAETSQQQKEMRFFSTCGERLGDNSSDRDCGPGIEGVLASSLRRGSALPGPVRHRSGVEMTPAEVRFFELFGLAAGVARGKLRPRLRLAEVERGFFPPVRGIGSRIVRARLCRCAERLPVSWPAAELVTGGPSSV